MVLSRTIAESPDLSLYGEADPRDLPRYTYTETSRATRVPSSTVAAWVRGMAYTKPGRKSGFVAPVIQRPVEGDSRLSFHNLVEVHNLRCLRYGHDVRLSTVREAIRLAQEEHGIDRLLIHPELRTSGGALFLDKYFHLVELSFTRQIAMREMLKSSLARIRTDKTLRPSGLSPDPLNPRLSKQEVVLVSPYVSFGDAVIERRGISTSAIASRVNEGEAMEIIIEDYRITEDEFAEAVLYEAAA